VQIHIIWWRAKALTNVLVTGGSGFLGSHIIHELKQNHYNVLVMDIKPPKQKGIGFIKQDIRKPLSIGRDFDYCIHLAALVGGIQFFHAHRALNIHDNSLILANLFEACANSNIKRIIYSSSSVVYQHAKTFPTPEEETKRIPPPSSAYGYTKLLGEYFCEAYREDRGLPYTILRPFNAYGPGEAPDMDYAHAIPQLVWKVLNCQYPVEIFGSGEQTRCFTYGTDIARAFVLSMGHPKAKNEAFNVSSNQEIRIIDVLRKIWELTDQKKPLAVKNLPPFPEDVIRRIPSTEKIKEKLGWRAEVSFEEGLTKTIRWLKKFTKHPPKWFSYTSFTEREVEGNNQSTSRGILMKRFVGTGE